MKSVGDDYEARAAGWLQGRGLQLLARNFRARTGEIDIVARDAEHLVFLEVRARSNRCFASAAGSVDRRKQQRIVRTAQAFLLSLIHISEPTRPTRASRMPSSA